MWGQGVLTWKEHERVFWTAENFKILIGMVTAQMSKFTQLNPYNFFFYTLKVKVKLLSRVRLFATPWTVAYQPPSSMGFSRQEYCSGLPFPMLQL